MYLDTNAPLVLEMADTLIEALQNIRISPSEDNGVMLDNMRMFITTITDYCNEINYKIGYPNRLKELLANTAYSLENIKLLYRNGDIEQVVYKIECELTALILMLNQHLKFILVDAVDEISLNASFRNETQYLRELRNKKKVIPEIDYKYDVSIVVLFYNNMEMTKQCIESILKHSKGYNCEIIMINNGSDEETTWWSESLPGIKKIYYKENMGPTLAGFSILDTAVLTTQGRYVAYVSNDVIVTKNWLENLIACLDSDPSIGMAVPLCNSLSNRQAMEVNYTTMDEMQQFAEEFNVSDKTKWQERARLLSFLVVVRPWMFGEVGAYTPYFCYDMFADDDMSVKIRRAGYKQVLCNDTFVHHYGSATIKEAQFDVMDKGKKQFFAKYGVHPWKELTFEYCINILNIKGEPKKGVKVLSINPGFGDSTMEFRWKLQLSGFKDIHIDGITENARLLEDLASFCNDSETFENMDAFLKGKSYDYIIFGGKIEDYEIPLTKLLFALKPFLSKDGYMYLSIKNPYYYNTVLSLISIKNINDEMADNQLVSGFVSGSITYEAMSKTLVKSGYTLEEAMNIKNNSPLVESYIPVIEPLIPESEKETYAQIVSIVEFCLLVKHND